MRTGNKAPGLRIVGGTAYGPVGAEIGSSSEPIFRHPEPPSTETLSTTTARNGKLREKRKEIWRMAEAATRYWQVRLTFHDAISEAQRMEIPEGRNHPITDSDDRSPIVQHWREALVRQVLTPAPDANSVKWKQWALDSGDLQYTGVKQERVERAIADDLAFLAAHPVRQSNRRPAKANTSRPTGDE
jgi:hypothetical protein